MNDPVISDNNTTDGIEKNNLVSYNGMLKIENNTLVNSKGEKIQLKGISTHGIQWYGKYANEKVIKNLRDEWGANLFRIAMYTSEGGYLQDRTIKNKVYEIQLKKPLPSRSIGYAYLKRRSLSQATLKFIELIDQFDKSI